MSLATLNLFLPSCVNDYIMIMASSNQHMVSSCILICEVNLKDSDIVFTNPHVSFQSCRAVFKEEEKVN